MEGPPSRAPPEKTKENLVCSARKALRRLVGGNFYFVFS